jgi:Nucleotide-diphospho-sugar transferase
VSKAGVIFVAAGAPYVLAANRAAKSVREHSPLVGIDLFTNLPDLAADIFDQVRPLEGPHRRSKVDCLHQTRFERTLYLDTDVRLVADIAEMFKTLDRFDIALAHAHARNRDQTQQMWRIDIPRAFPQMNSGVILFKSTTPVLAFLRAWQQAYHSAGFRKDQVTLRELLWCSDLRLHILPPEYNIRYERYLSFWDPKEAVPQILHLAKFHAQAGPEPKRAQKRQLGVDLLSAIKKRLGLGPVIAQD